MTWWSVLLVGIVGVVVGLVVAAAGFAAGGVHAVAIGTDGWIAVGRWSRRLSRAEWRQLDQEIYRLTERWVSDGE